MDGVEAIKLPRVIVERLSREARRLGISVDELLLELVLRDLDPPVRVRSYAEASRDLIEQALEELRRGNVRQAAEKVWGAAALAVKAYAEWRDGRRLTGHSELWEYKRVLERELGEWVHDSWMSANGMHTCFYEGWCGAGDVEKSLERVKRLVEEIASRVLRR